MIYGAVIDSTCVVLQQSCTRQGACLLYDHDVLRLRLHVLAFCTQLVTASLKALAWHCSRRQEKVRAAAAAAGDVDIAISHRGDDAGKTSNNDDKTRLDTAHKETTNWYSNR